MFPGLMTLDFFRNPQMVGSEFGIINMKTWIHLHLYDWFRLLCRCNSVFSVLLQKYNTTHLSIIAVHPLMTTVYLSFDGCFQPDN